MASKKKNTSWLMWRLHRSDSGTYYVELWTGEGADEPSASDLDGFPRRTIWTHAYPSTDGAARAASKLRSADMFDAKRSRDLGIPADYPNEIVPRQPLVVTFGVFATVKADDHAQFQDAGLDPDATTLAEFYELTGEYPSSLLDVELKIGFVPAEWKNALGDIANMTDSGWFIHDVVEGSEVSKGRQDRWISVLKQAFASDISSRKHGMDLRENIESFCFDNAHPFWQGAGPHELVLPKK